MVLALTALLLSLLFAPAAANAAVSTAASASASGAGSASTSLTVAGANRLLAVGVSTLESATVTSVTYGAQVLTRREASAKDSSRAELWTLVAPNTGTATVSVTLSTGAPVVLGATVLNGVDQQFPNLASNSMNANNGANSASLVLNGTVEADGMVGVLTVNDSPNITAIRTNGSVDTVVADQQWTGRQGSILSAGATRRGWTGQNLSLYGGINWFWNRIDPSHLMPYSNVIAAFKAAAAVAPTATAPTATNVTHNSATLGGSMTDTGGGNILERGVVYCVCADPQLGNATTVYINSSQVPGALTTGVSGLTPSTTYTYRAYATNGAGTGYSDTATFRTAAPPNLPPTAGVGGPYTIDEGDSLTLAGSGTDPEGQPLTFAWDLDGDNNFEDATGATPTLTAAQLTALGLGDGPVTRNVRVGVSDGVNVKLSGTTTLTVRNVAPTATLSAPAAVAEGGSASVTLSGTHDPSSADLAAGLRYAYDFDNDGSWDIGGATYASATTSASASVPASLLADGPAARTIRAAVIDKDGGKTEYTKTIDVTNVAPTATLADVTVDEGTPATVAFTDQADPFDTTFTYEWDVDGTGFKPGGASVTLPAAGGPAKLTVKGAILDKDGGRREYSARVEVRNVAPTAKLTGATVDEGETATVAFSDQADAFDTAFTYQWSVDGGEFTPGGATLEVPTTDGPNTIHVRGAILDSDGGRSVYETTVEVRNVAPKVTITGPEAVPASGEVTLNVAAKDATAVTGTIDWGDGTVVPFAAGDVSHTYAGPGARTVTVKVADEAGAEGSATHALTVATLPAPHTPTAPAPAATPAPTPAAPAGGGVLGATDANVKITGLRATPRCVNVSEGLKAISAQARTIKVQFRMNIAADVKFSFKRWSKAGFTKCPPSKGVAQQGGSKIPGVYSPFSNRPVSAKRGLNTVTLAATSAKGKTLKPGTYLLTVTAGDASARTKVWVLAG